MVGHGSLVGQGSTLGELWFGAFHLPLIPNGYQQEPFWKLNNFIGNSRGLLRGAQTHSVVFRGPQNALQKPPGSSMVFGSPFQFASENLKWLPETSEGNCEVTVANRVGLQPSATWRSPPKVPLGFLQQHRRVANHHRGQGGLQQSFGIAAKLFRSIPKQKLLAPQCTVDIRQVGGIEMFYGTALLCNTLDDKSNSDLNFH